MNYIQVFFAVSVMRTAYASTELGCMVDNRNSRSLSSMHILKNNSPGNCESHCLSLDEDYVVFGLQYEVECFCGTISDDITINGIAPSKECDMSCPGEPQKICGGKDRFNGYTIDIPSRNLPPQKSPMTEALNQDIVKIIDVVGDNPPGEGWADSFSVGDKCYMKTTFDHDIGETKVDTPQGIMTIRQLFDALEPAPSSMGRPLYNDIQCGNGPSNGLSDEINCPGLVEYKREGCGQIGPMWDLSELE